ncbi:MAG: SDR family oxidoreductase [Kiritimatiellae bacterium]|nr:SDR family oxidoreductase [Kiritimatiellia bacterium]
MKSVLITGGTVRLGIAIAERLRTEGWRVLTSSHRADAGADIVADLAEPMGAAKLYAATLKLLNGNPPDALVNNAALFTGDAAAITAINLEAPKKLTTLMAGREAGVGAVVNILDSVVLGFMESAWSLGSGGSKATLSDPKRPYFASKRELAAFTRSAAATFAATLRVNGVAPGPVMAPTDVHVKAGEMLLDRRPTADDVAAAVSYLLSAESVTGAVIPVDAGQHLA